MGLLTAKSRLLFFLIQINPLKCAKAQNCLFCFPNPGVSTQCLTLPEVQGAPSPQPQLPQTVTLYHSLLNHQRPCESKAMILLNGAEPTFCL